MSVAFPASRRLLAGGAPLRWFTKPVRAIKKKMTWGQPENTDLLGLAIVVE